MDTLNYITKKYNLDLSKKSPFFLEGGRRKSGLAGLFYELGYKTGVEIGTERGRYAKTLCEAMPGLKLSCVDSWTSYKDYREGISERQNEFHKEAMNRLSPYDCTLIKSFSMDALKFFEDESLDFVFIDGNHDFINIAQDLWHWREKVKKGGIAAGHDFVRIDGIKGEYIHVKDVVQAYMYSLKVNPWFVFKGDRCPSWFYIKE